MTRQMDVAYAHSEYRRVIRSLTSMQGSDAVGQYEHPNMRDEMLRAVASGRSLPHHSKCRLGGSGVELYQPKLVVLLSLTASFSPLS